MEDKMTTLTPKVQYETPLSYYIHSLVGGGSISAKMRSVV